MVWSQTVVRTRAESRHRTRRLGTRIFFIVQCGVGAALAWWVAADGLHHLRPFFAPVTAIISLGMSFGQRVRRVTEVTIGVAVGVFVGDAFVHYFGSGVWQLAVVTVIAMSTATLLGAGALLTTQAGVQSVIVTTLVAAPGQAFTRWLDAVVGGVVALVLTVVAPAAPIRRPRQQAAVVVRELASILQTTVEALRTHDADLASAALVRARASEGMLEELRALSAEGIAVVRLSPLRRRHLPGVQAIAGLLEPLDRGVRNLRVLVRRATIATWRHEVVPDSYLDLFSTLVTALEDIARELGERRLPVNARTGLVRLGRESAAIDPAAGLSGEVMRAQLRSIVVDLLMLTGLDEAQARATMPASSPPTDDEP